MSTPPPARPSPPALPPESWVWLVRFVRLARRPLDRFLHVEAASGIVLLLATAFALLAANSPWAASYAALWHLRLGIHAGPVRFERSLEWLVNDGLMVIFFFVVGLEIRRELDHGVLSEWRRAVLPVTAALGGMVVPALLYLAAARAPAERSGWGVPMATDIAFAVGVLALLGKRVPASLRVLLLALAVIDDIGAIVVIALFYSSSLSFWGLIVAAAGMLGVLLLQRLGVRSRLAYVAPGLVVWAGIYAAGVHPTIAGVLLGLCTPVRAWLSPEGFVAHAGEQLEVLANADSGAVSAVKLLPNLRRIALASREVLSPVESLIEALHPWVAFAIMPLFALANAGVSVSGAGSGQATSAVTLGVALGLVVGKPLGVLAASWLALRLGIARLPAELGWRALGVLGVVAGVGFTMALFVAQLAFTDEAHLTAAKIGVLVASGAAGVLGLALGRLSLGAPERGSIEESVDDAELESEA